MKESLNPSSIDSRKRIFSSLIDLMLVKDFNKITITEIAENAEVVRRTFYRNFNSKDDVINSYSKMLIEEFINIIQIHNINNCHDALRHLFYICKEHKDYFNALKRNNKLIYILSQWTEILPSIHELFKDKLTNFPQTTTKESLDYLLTFNVGGTFNIIIKWINDGMILSPDELSDIINNTINYL